MGIGLYEAGFATLPGIYGKEARGPITGITRIAGFASTVGWPLSGVMLATWGWREVCIGWALIHLTVALPLNAWLPKETRTVAAEATPIEEEPPPSRLALWLPAFVFAATWFNYDRNGRASAGVASSRRGQHGGRHRGRCADRPGAGRGTGAGARAAAPVPPACLDPCGGCGASRRCGGAGELRKAPAYAFALLHGAGNGILTIAKSTLPQALFGAAGYGRRIGRLNAPARNLQAAARRSSSASR